MYCKLCGSFIGFLNMFSFCEDCGFIRRLYLLNKEGDERKAFIAKIKSVFLKSEEKEEEYIPNFIDKRRL